jgi:hypothetical protein
MNHQETSELARPQSLADIFRATWSLYSKYPLLFATLAFVVIAPYEVVVLVISGTDSLARAVDGGSVISLLIDVVSVAITGSIVSALHVQAVAYVRDGRKPHLSAVGLDGMHSLPQVLLAEIIAQAGISVGYLALGLPGIILSLRWAVVAQTAAIEKLGWLAALGRSARLSHGSYWHIALLLLTVGVVVFGVDASLLWIGLGARTSVAVESLRIIVHTLTASFVALTMACLYFDLVARENEPASRRRREYGHLRGAE